MMDLVTKTEIAKSFFEKYEKELFQRADTAGLLKHRPSSGVLKEFLTRSVLNLILPECFSLLTGQVFDGNGSLSNQIDIIVYDSRLPKLEVAPHFGYYPIEGVVACIEVKPFLNKNSINEALSNAMSVLTLNPILAGDPIVATNSGIIPPKDPISRRKASFQYSTANYIFSFHSLKMKTAAKHINSWFNSNNKPMNQLKAAFLPRVILGNNWVGLLNDGYIDIPEYILGKAPSGNAMILINTKHTFAYFLSHLLNKVALRVRANHAGSLSYFTFNPMLPISEYMAEDLRRTDNIIIRF